MKYSEKIKELAQHASSCQLAADEMAIKLINQNQIFSAISIFQSRCNFNLSWLYQLSPEIVLHTYSLDFLANNVELFKRKLKVNEILFYDFIITHQKITDFDQFKKILIEIKGDSFRI